jgi:di/tricarboxylate transporter
MQLTQWLLVIILVIPLALVMVNRLRMDLAALLMAVLLGVLQFAGLGMLGPAHTPLDAIKAISGFSQPVVITLISLFILTRGLEKSGVTRWIAKQILRIGGSSPSRLIALFATVTALLSLFMNNLAAGALVLPSAMEASRRTGIKPSKLLIPVAYGSLLGGSATYFTTANIIMSDLLRIAHPPQAALNILDFTPTGGLIAIAGIIFLWLFGNRLLPDRQPTGQSGITRRTGSELEELYQIGERLWQARLKPGSQAAGHALAEMGIGKNWGVAVAAIQHGNGERVVAMPDQPVRAQDQLLLIGREEKVRQLEMLGFDICPVEKQNHLSTFGMTLAELILAPHASWEGKTLKALDFRRRYGLSAIALKRLARSYRTDVGDLPLAMGDSLLVLGSLDKIRALQKSPDVLVFEPDPGDQPIDLRQTAISVGITLAAIGASIAGVPVFLSVLTGAILSLLLNIISIEEAYQSIEWQAIFLITGMYAVSLAMVQTGLANLVGESMLAVLKPLGALGVAGGAYLLTAILTQFMGGQVSALVTGPVVISAALSIGVNPQAVAVATAIGCSASFFTPMAHPVNILMIAPANYKFSDFFRAGWLMTILSFVMLLVGLILFWRL